MSLLEELSPSDEAGPPRKSGGLVDELTGLDADGEADKAEQETREAAEQQLGEAAMVALKGNDAKGLYQAIRDIIANEG